MEKWPIFICVMLVTIHSFANSILGHNSCNEIFNLETFMDSSPIQELGKSSRISKKQKKKIEELLKLFNKPHKDEISREYIRYINTLAENEMGKAIDNFQNILINERSSKYAKTFFKRLNHFKNYEKEQLKFLAKMYKGIDQNSLKNIAKHNTYKYKKIYNGCHTKGITQEHKHGAKKFKLFTIGISSASAGGSYIFSNYDKKDFATTEGFKKLGYEMTMDAVWAGLASVIFKDPKGGYWSKAIKFYLADNALVAADATLWNYAFTEDRDWALKRIEQLKKDPNRKKELKKLQEVLSKEYFVTKVKKRFRKILSSLSNQPYNPVSINLDDKNINLDDSKIQEQLIKAILLEKYESEKGKFASGNEGFDRYGFYSAMGIPLLLSGSAVTMEIYKTLCMSPLNPKGAFLKAALMFSAYSVVADAITYPLRREAIGQ